MNPWYLVASLPTLRLGQPAPIAPAALRELCREQLPAADLREFDAVLAGGGTSAMARALLAFTAELRDACVDLRAARLGVDATAHRAGDAPAVPDLTLRHSVAEAFSAQNPRDREFQLDELRWRFLDQWLLGRAFSVDAVFAYGLRLQACVRWQQRTADAGRRQLLQQLDTMLAGIEPGARTNP